MLEEDTYVRAIPHRRTGGRFLTDHWPAWPAGRLLAMLLALSLLLVGCGSDDGDDPGDDGTATEAAEEETEEPAAEDEGEEPAEEAEEPTADEPPAEPVTITMGWHTPGQEFSYVMQHNPDVAPNYGTWYEIEWIQLPVPQQAQNLGSGATDGGVLPSNAVPAMVEQGADVVITGVPIMEDPAYRGLEWLVRTDSGITSPADLAGATVGTIGEGSYADRIADHVIREQGGLEPGADYDKTDVQFPVMSDALLSGQIDTGVFAPPFMQQTLATGEAETLFVSGDAREDLVVTVQAFRRDFVEENMAVMEKFVEDWATVYAWIQDPANRDAVLEATSAATEVPAEVLANYLLTEEEGLRPPNGSVDLDALQNTWDFFREEGAYEADLDVDDYVLDNLLPPEA